MDVYIFVLCLGLGIAVVLAWGVVTLPKESWQMAAVVPLKKRADGDWKGLNLTWYGVLSANAYTFGVILTVVLAASAKIPLSALVMMTLLLLGVTIPASRIIAGLVEKKKGTLTVGGAVFTGVVIAPWLIMLVNLTLGRAAGFHIPALHLMACLSIAYTFGEGLGRLACLSFGCCYGKPLSECSPFLQRLFSRFYVVYTGHTKKVSYASGMAGEKMLPIQIITAVMYSLAGLAGTLLYLKGCPGAALFETILVTQVWRVISEFFRADFRGDRKFSMYQIMALCTVCYAGVTGLVLPSSTVALHLADGGFALWHPGMILFFQGVWLVSFLHAGRSSVTGARLSFHVIRENI